MDTLIQVGVGLAIIGAIFGFSWWIAGVQTNREFGRRDRAQKAAEKLRDEVFAIRKAYRDQEKRMPLTLDKLLEDSYQTYRILSERSFWVRNEQAVTDIARQADEAVAAIKAQVQHVPTIEELDADAAALKERLDEFEQKNAEGVAEAHRKHEEELEALKRKLSTKLTELGGTLESMRQNTERALAQIEADKASHQ